MKDIPSLAALLLTALALFLSPAQAQNQDAKPLTRAEVEKGYAEIKGEHAKLVKVVDDLQARIGESGWKALDATTKLNALQWQTYGFILALLVAITFGGWQGIKLLRDKMEADFSASMSKHENVLRHSTGALAFGELSHGFWVQYSAVPPGAGAAPEKKRMLDAAMLHSGYALEHAEKLEALDAEKYEELITNVRANHAYWLAEESDSNLPGKPNPKNAEPALRIAKLAYKVAAVYMQSEGSKFINRWPDWIESYCYVLMRFGTADEKKAAKELVLAVCNDVRVDAAWRAKTRNEYEDAATA
jgi:hypothetical protein